jgi:indolepyruvate ferredoxin oxidoreductase alpha subunit
VKTVEQAFELSEASNTPVFLQMRIRSCHVHGSFVAKDNVRPSPSMRDAMENPVRDLSRIVLPPASFLHEHETVLFFHPHPFCTSMKKSRSAGRQRWITFNLME